MGTGSYILCPSCAGKRHRLRRELLGKHRCSVGAGSSTRDRTCDNEVEPVRIDEYIAESLDDVLFQATVHSRDQTPRLWTQNGSIQDVR